MRIKKSQLNEIISGYLNEVFGIQRFKSTGNPRVDSFREELRGIPMLTLEEATKWKKILKKELEKRKIN